MFAITQHLNPIVQALMARIEINLIIWIFSVQPCAQNLIPFPPIVNVTHHYIKYSKEKQDSALFWLKHKSD
jgi:hypothetical protein